MSRFIERGGLFVVAQFGLLATLGGLPFLLPSTAPAWVRAMGLVFAVLGTTLFLFGATSLGSSLTPLPKPLESATLRTAGAYRLVRHPIYGGIILGFGGYLLALAALPCLLGVLALIAFFDLKARREERWLRERYPDYEAYAKQRKRFIPWIY